MTDHEVINALHRKLVPRGPAPVVQLRLADHGMFNHDFVESCINTMHTRLLAAQHLGDKISPLEKLAIHVLLDSAYIDSKGL